MSYRCQQCNVQVPKGQTQIKKVTKVRHKIYPERTETVYTQFGPRERVLDAGGSGFEIVEELCLCSGCAE